MRTDYPIEYDQYSDENCAHCQNELPEIPADAGPHLGPLWEGFCSEKCRVTNAKEEQARTDARFAVEASPVNYT